MEKQGGRGKEVTVYAQSGEKWQRTVGMCCWVDLILGTGLPRHWATFIRKQGL